jgi:hypothetical protein
MDGHDADEVAIAAGWESSGTRDAIAGYLASLGQRGAAR